MAIANRRVSAASARSHTRRNQMSSKSSSFGTIKQLSTVLLVGLAVWLYQAIQPPPPKICGTPNGPPVTSSRIKLRDGRHLAYLESGVPKEKANYKIVFVNGFYTCRHDVLPISQEVIEELGIYFVTFDRSGYGESDPDTKKTEKSAPLDVEELADQLGLGSKFHLIGYSMGGAVVWGCLKFIPHRLASAALLAPVSNYWWPGFPANVSKAAWNLQRTPDKFAVGVAHYAPWLTYWWNTQKWFPRASLIDNNLDIFPAEDMMLLPKLISQGSSHRHQITQQGEFESLHRDMMVGFGHWEFDPMDLDNPYPNGEGSVHLWHGAEDRIVPASLSRYISQKLSWIHYHELPSAGHLFALADGMADTVVKSLLIGDQK